MPARAQDSKPSASSASRCSAAARLRGFRGERRGNEQRLNRNAAVERRLQLLVHDALVRGMHVDENEPGAVLREHVIPCNCAIANPNGCASSPGISVGVAACSPNSRRVRGRLVRVERHCLLAISGGAGGVTRAAAVAMQARVREGRGALFDRAWRVRAGIPCADTGRGRRSQVLGVGHFAHRPPAEPACAGRAHEHPLRRHHQGVVRRRRRSDAGARPPAHPGRPGYAGLPSGDEGSLRGRRTASPTTTNTRSGATNISICRIARKRAASAAFSTTGMIPATGTPTSPSRRTSAAPS